MSPFAILTAEFQTYESVSSVGFLGDVVRLEGAESTSIAVVPVSVVIGIVIYDEEKRVTDKKSESTRENFRWPILKEWQNKSRPRCRLGDLIEDVRMLTSKDNTQ